ncbi:Aminotransferase-like, plant mobile domain [Sesbania bispinosa]|nr:Aminotransferase-like, plant mobile domain [Sesbania bispinosa]
MVRLGEALLFHEVQKTSTHTVGPSLLRSHLLRGEFPWSPCNYVACAYFTSCWAEWVNHVFTNDPPFVKVMEKAGIAGAIKASPRLGVFRRVEDLNCIVQRWSRVTHTFFTSWGEFTPTLEDVHVLMRLPLFGDYDVSSSPVDSHIIDRAKELMTATIESAKYSR